MKYPHAQEKQIQRIISNIYKKYTDKIITHLRQTIPISLNRQDDFASDFTIFMRNLEKEAYIEFSEGFSLAGITDKILEFMLRYKEEEIAEYMKSVTGRYFYGTTEWWDLVKTEWVNTLSISVANNAKDYLDSIQDIVYNAIKDGKSRDFIIGAILKSNSNLSIGRATFLAKDMTGRLNGIIEQQLQLSLGIEGYFWQTMNDERVRGKPGGVYAGHIPSHWAMESKVCKWADPSVISYDIGKTWVPRSTNMPYKHPGQDWLCRCSGAPFSFSLLREIDKELLFEKGASNG
jgi:uncharacterized protein with gpF-like domain